ncbi:MAG: hypothetical protein AB7Y46_05190 [Armatimonadota bacterium]
MATISGLAHAMAFEYNGLLYVIGYRAGAQYLRRSADRGQSWLRFGDGSEERLVALPSDEQRVAFVKMATQGRALVVGVPNFPDIDIYVSCDDGESWEADGGG